VSAINCSPVAILPHTLDLNHEIVPPPTYRLEIQIQLFNVPYNALLDSGASVSAISENLFKILKNDSSKHNIPLFPLSFSPQY